jgi:hypothetical protein
MGAYTMAEAYSFPPFEEEMKKIVDKFGGKRMETYRGEDITPLWDLKGEGLPWSYKYLYTAPKLEKIVFAVQSFRDKLMSYATGIWPDDVHHLFRCSFLSNGRLHLRYTLYGTLP